ncbi:hypothetical protein B7463_g11919, partial [Scytalidium lignicola]
MAVPEDVNAPQAQDHEHVNGRDGVSQIPKPQQITTVSQVPFPPFGKLANPGPLGLIGFALTTFVLGLYQCGAGLPHSNPESNVGPDQAVFGLAIFMGGFAQFVVGIMEFRVGNTFVAALRTNYTIIGVFFFLVLAFLFLSIAQFISAEHPQASIRVNKAGGTFTIICAFIAFYAGGSGLMIQETTFVQFPLGGIPRHIAVAQVEA